MKHRPRKRFGQNFLQNPHIISEILSVICLKKNDKLIEIGPGLGALTQPLLRSVEHLIAIEIDRDLQERLNILDLAQDRLELISGDALTIDYSQWGNRLRILGNLPYNISTPLLFHLLNFASFIEDMHFMLQKEVVDRLAAKPGSKAYGRLSVMVQYHCEVESLFEVPAEAFDPVPKVNSAIVRLVPYQNSPYFPVDLAILRQLVTTAFSMRRKTIANNLKPLLSALDLSKLGVDPQLRPEQISVSKYVEMTQWLSK